MNERRIGPLGIDPRGLDIGMTEVTGNVLQPKRACNPGSRVMAKSLKALVVDTGPLKALNDFAAAQVSDGGAEGYEAEDKPPPWPTGGWGAIGTY